MVGIGVRQPVLRRLRELLKKSGFVVGLVSAARAAKTDCVRLRAFAGRSKVIGSYLREQTDPKLQLGAGPNALAGWLNTDIRPLSADVAYLDATRPFPLADQTFHYVFSEHLIEHVSYVGGVSMLRECFRVLAPGGRIRISTPNLRNLVALLAAERTHLQDRYIRWAVDEHVADADGYKPSFVVNNFFWDFHHLFVYDPETLQSAMEAAGFTDIAPCLPGESEDEQLRGLESHGKLIGEEMNRFETMVFEAVRPALRPSAQAPCRRQASAG